MSTGKGSLAGQRDYGKGCGASTADMLVYGIGMELCANMGINCLLFHTCLQTAINSNTEQSINFLSKTLQSNNLNLKHF